jgi:hypothetical protein
MIVAGLGQEGISDLQDGFESQGILSLVSNPQLRERHVPWKRFKPPPRESAVWATLGPCRAEKVTWDLTPSGRSV